MSISTMGPTTGSFQAPIIIGSSLSAANMVQITDSDHIVSWWMVRAAFPNGFGDPRSNQVFRLGWNLAPGGGLQNPAEPALGISMEDYYVANAGQVGTGQMEFHISYVSPASVEYRPLTFSADRATNFIDFGHQIDQYTILRRSDGAQMMQYYGFNTTPSWLFNKGTNVTGNNTADTASTWQIIGANGNATFTGSLAAGTTGVTSAHVLNCLSTQGPNALAINNEVGLIFSVGPSGGLTNYSDQVFQGNTAIFGAGQLMRLKNAGLSFASTGITSWSSTVHAYDPADSGVSRSSAGVVAIGTGAAGSAAGTLYCSTVRFSTALSALGGGAAPTLGTIGGTGPATAAQNSWLKLIDSTGASCWVPVWK